MTLLVIASVLAVAALAGVVGVERAGGGVRRGFASGFAVTRSMSRLAMWATTVQTRPRTRCWPWRVRGHGTPARELGIDLGSTSWWGRFRRRVFASFESVVVILGPPGTGKTGALSSYVENAPGPGTAASTSIDLWKNTHEVRERIGPVYLFNPDNDGDIPSNVCWPIVPGCDDTMQAMLRAGALIEGGATEGLKDGDYWLGHAHRTLYTFLMAAALDEVGMDTVAAWCGNLTSKRPADIIAKHPRAPKGWGNNLTWMHSAKSEKAIEGVMLTLKPIVEFLADPKLRPLVIPSPGMQVFDAEGMIRRNGFLYLVATHRPNSPLGPLTTALTAHVHDTAKRLGAVKRLDPPLGEFLDEAYLTARVPLPQYTSDARKYGIYEVIGGQNWSQFVEVWGQEGAATIWNNAVLKIAFNSITDDKTLEHLSKLCGKRWTKVNGRLEKVPVMEPDAIKNMDDGQALAVYRNQRGLLLTPEPIWKRPRRDVPAPTARPAATPKPVGVVDLSEHRDRREQREAS